MADHAPERHRRFEQVMGTVIGIDAWGDEHVPPAVDEAFDYLRAVDARFSPYVPTSEISRLASGLLDESECGADVRWVLGLCDDLTRTTDGYFDPRGHRADGRFDPSGVVKGWSIDQAGWLLERAGVRRYVINAGGDILLRDFDADDPPWRIGIRDPSARDRIVASLAVRNGAVATSGAYERGAHVVDPHSGRPPEGLLSLTVHGPTLAYADAYATAGFAMGRSGVDFVASHPGYGAFAITEDGTGRWTADVDPLLGG